MDTVRLQRCARCDFLLMKTVRGSEPREKGFLEVTIESKISGFCRRKQLVGRGAGTGAAGGGLAGQQLSIFSVPHDVVLLVVDLLDLDSALALLRSCQWFHSMLGPCDSFWKMLCIKTEFANYSCLESQPASRQLGWAGMELHNTGEALHPCLPALHRCRGAGPDLRRTVAPDMAARNQNETKRRGGKF